jgi:hypothetical protein
MFITRVTEKYANLAAVIRYLATLLSDGYEIAPIRFPMSENIFEDTKIMFLDQLSGNLSQKN